LQRLQEPGQIKEDNLNDVRRETANLSGKKKKYLKDKFNELATQSKSNNIRDLHREEN
jgi:hypothetical protein